jgi:hypothetical protein
MKSTWSPEHGSLVKSSYASTPFDDLPFFGGRKIKETGNSEIASLLIDAGIPGASHNNGRQKNLELYDAHLETFRKKAADKAVADFLGLSS